MLILKCSPRPRGASALLADHFGAGAMDAGAEVTTLSLSSYAIAPCIACDACESPPHACILDVPGDGAEEIFSMFRKARLIAIASPIYFYALPALLKALVDRGQKLWRRHKPELSLNAMPAKGIVPILTAGRLRGKLLFSGALRTLNWFFKNLDGHIIQIHVFRGMEGAESVTTEMEREVWKSGHDLAKKLME